MIYTCLTCPFLKSFIAPYPLTVSDDKTEMERMKECGFTEVVFTDPHGYEGSREKGTLSGSLTKPCLAIIYSCAPRAGR